MDRGAWRATARRVAKLDTTEGLSSRYVKWTYLIILLQIWLKIFFFHYQLTTLLNIYYAFSLVVAIVDLETG